MTQSTTARQARALALDAHTIAATIDAALTNLDTAQAGWPTSTPGAADAGATPPIEGWCNEPTHYQDDPALPDHPCRHPLPCPNHPNVNTSIVERTAGHDTARRDLDALRQHIRKATHHARAAARIALAHGTPRLDKTAIGDKIAELDQQIWCEHCLKLDMRNVKAPESTLCEFCRSFRIRWKRLPTRRVFLCREGRGGKLYDNDIIRIHAEEKRDAEEAKARQKAAQKAAQRLHKMSPNADPGDAA